MKYSYLLLILIIICLVINIYGFHLNTFDRIHKYTNQFVMRDGSSRAVFFKIGDIVKVCQDVIHNPPNNLQFNSIGLVGTVKDIWEKCEIDPHWYLYILILIFILIDIIMQ